MNSNNLQLQHTHIIRRRQIILTGRFKLNCLVILIELERKKVRLLINLCQSKSVHLK